MSGKKRQVGRTGMGNFLATRLLCGASLAAVVLALPSIAHAQNQDRYWDANGAQPGSGGAGNWNLTSPLWSEANSDVLGPYRAWVNDPANPDNAIFGASAPGVPTTAGTITLTSPITVHNLTFQSVHGWILSGNTLTLAGVTPTITTIGDTTIGSVIDGTAGLVKAGGRTLALTGVNTFSGGITINGGTLIATSDAALGALSNNITTAAGVVTGFNLTGSTNRTVTIGSGGRLNLAGTGGGSARITGDGDVAVSTGVWMTNDANDYTGKTSFTNCNGNCSTAFSSIGNLGEASSLGAPTTVENGTITWNQTSQYTDYLVYTGDGDRSDRNWIFNSGTTGTFLNQGTGTLRLTGDFTVTGSANFIADFAAFELLGVLGGNADMVFTNTNSITLGGANSYTGTTLITDGTVYAPVLADAGINSSFGTGSMIALTNGGMLAYTGTGSGSDREFTGSAAVGILNNGTGALTLAGPFSFVVGGPVDSLTLGGSYTGTNIFSGLISGDGNLISTGSSIWELTGANSYIGTVTVDGGTLRAGDASAFGTITGLTVNGGTLDLNGYDLTVPSLSGLGGAVALNGGADLIVKGLGPTNNSAFAGSISGDGGLTKRGTSTLTLSGQSSYTGATTIQGGTLALNFADAAAPSDNIIGATSPLVMSGGTLSVTGAAGEANSQTFGGLTVTAGTNRIVVASGAGGTMNVDLGTLSSTGGLMDFTLPTAGDILTSSPDGTLGWATVNGRDYAQVLGGVISAFTAYADKDDAAGWVDGDFVTDEDGDADSFSGIVNGSIALGGLRYTAANSSIVTIGTGETLQVGGTIIVASSVGNTTQEITGGRLTGPAGGGTLGILNDSGTFTVSSTITDNGADSVGFTKAGNGTVVLTGANSYTGATTLSGGTLSVSSIADGNVDSTIGASSNASSNLVIESGRLYYTGGTASTDRGFTLVNGGPARTIDIASGTTNLTFSGVVTSPDDAGLTKTGAGILTLSNAANDYVGITRIESGTLSVGTLADGNLASGIGAASSDAANLVLLDGGRLQYTGGTTGIDRGATLETGAGRFDVTQGTTALTMSGTIIGSGRLEKYGDGTLVLSGANTYSGGTIVNGGTLQAGATGVFGNPAALMTVTSGTLDLADNSNQIGALNGAGNVTLGSLDTTTLTIGGANSSGTGFTGSISGAGNVTHTNGTQIMTGCGNSYTGITTMTGAFGGSILATDCIRNGNENSGIGASTSDSANLVFENGGQLHYTATATNQTTDRGFTLVSGTGYITVNDADTTLEFQGAVVGAGGLNKRGDGTLTLSGANSYVGPTAVEGGILRSGSATAFNQTTRLFLSNATNSMFDLNDFNATFSALDGGGALSSEIALGDATLTLLGTESRNYSGVISGSGVGGIIKLGNGTQGLVGCDSSYTGTTTIRGGVLQVNCLTNGLTDSSIGASSNAASNLVIESGTLRYLGAGDTTDRLFTLGVNTTLDASGTGALVFSNTGPIALSNPGVAQSITLRGASAFDNKLAPLITDNGAGQTNLTKTDVGTWILTNSANSYSGTTRIIGGVLGVDTLANGGTASSIGQSSNSAANLFIGSGGTLRYTGDGDTTDRLFTLAVGTTAIESVGTGAIVFDNTGNVAFSGSGARVISLGGTNSDDNIMGVTLSNQGANVTSLAKNGSGTWVLTGNNSFSGATVINDGNLVIGNGGTTGNAGTGNVIVDQASSTLSFNRSDTFNFTGTISGPGAIAQIGTGTTVLTATNSIGAARVDDGTLQVNGALRTATFAMNGDGALLVNGTVEGATAGTASAFTGDAGASMITVNSGGTLRATGDVGDGADTLVLAGLIDTGAGSFALGAGDDTLTLNDGGAITGTIDAGAGTDTLLVNNAAARTLDAAQAGGFEALDKQNIGTLTLTGDHAYSAGTTIRAGILSVGAGGTTGTLASDVVNDGELHFNRSDSSTFAGNITGTGSLSKLGGGALFLTGDATHSGGTTIQQGSLSIGDGGTTGSITGDILNNASLNFSRSDGYTYDGVISGSGSVTTRNGVVNLTADSNWAGATNVLDNSELRIASGNTVTSGGSTIINRGTLTVSGADSTFVTGTANAVAPSGPAVINVENGGTLRTTTGALAIRGSGSPSGAQLNISGANSLVDLAGELLVASSAAGNTASVTISAGGTLRSTGESLFGAPGFGNTTNPSFTITGNGSNWISAGDLAMRDGKLSLLDGGAASFASLNVGTVNAQAEALISGAGSTVTTSLGVNVGGLLTGRGTLTVADGGRVSAGSGITIGSAAAGTNGTVNIGAAAGAPAAAAGFVDGRIIFGPGTGTLNFNHTETNYVFANVISGAGTINQLAGVTRLTGASPAFAGTTNVSGGSLLVDGTLGSAASLVNVATGGTLGGSGTIGGNVTIADGRLAPGSSPGTLTINGNLALAAASQLDFEFGLANAPGNAINDVVNVAGNLTLDGTLNVAVSPGGSFDIGLYRVINYAGGLTNNGLTIGTLPAGVNAADLTVQTSIAGQVNLVNTSGATLNYWDGAAGPKFNDAVNGGSGVWQNSSGNDSWADQSGAVNAPFSDDAVAIFSATAGTVTVDDSLGKVSVAGMQFASNGYAIIGDSVTLVDPQSVIRVGDGSGAGAGYTATIGSALVGTAQLVKTDLGTLVLSAANSYTGGTLIDGGTLRISSDGNLGDVAGGLTLDGATLNTTTSFASSRAVDLTGTGTFLTNAGTTLTLDGLVSGAGGLAKDGAGTLLLATDTVYAGGTTITAGTLQLGNGGTIGSIVGNVANDGVLAFSRSDTLTFGGLISGTGALDQRGTGTTILTADNSYTGGTTITAGTLQLGNGGTSGAILGDVANGGVLAFNRSDEVTFAGLISGSGSIDQIGSGTTILTGNNSYAGMTAVVAGTLLVNGDQSMASGLTTVAAGATLGGVGTIGGDVGIVGTLAPGDASGPGTLTINGTLAFANGARLAYDFGESDVVGGPLNDLTKVGGDLLLDGTIDVTLSPGGSFDAGLYRVISYDGVLTNNGLDVGAMPAGSAVAVQTSVAGQVNLVNTAGLTLNFWDGAAGPKLDGAVNGGDGLWQTSSGNDNWTEISGSVNAPYSDGSFAIFSAAPGTVTVDNDLGTVTASGMQFASDGYTIDGDTLTLVGPQSIIRVGDGTADGKGYTATIATTLTGSSQLVKTDLGTLVLTGANSYTGGTRINVGTLSIASDANLGDAAGPLSFDGGILRTTADITSSRDVDMIGKGTFFTDAGTRMIFTGSLTGSGDLIKDGAGILALNETSDHTGGTTVLAGSLFINGDQSAATGLVSVTSGATLGGSGIIGGDVVVNDGAALAPGNSPGTLTINGDLALSSGSMLNYEFGQANVAGGALNDLTIVGGDLTLDGTINVSVSAGGTFGPGIYRVFDYGGALIDNGLDLAALPGGSVMTVQTSVAGQVNLVNTAGLTLRFWDGNAGPKNNSAIDGGSGVWQIGGNLDNWSEASGAVNAAYTQDSFAVFQGTAGTVTVDNGGGAVEASGLQFAVDGYTITGAPLTLTGTDAIVQVGDGSAAGAGYTATIAAALTGSARLVKTDAGTLVLTGANDYSGGTAINGGAIRIASDASLGDVAGGLSLNGGTLNAAADISSTRGIALDGAGTFLTDAGATLDLGGAITGAGSLIKSGAGTLALSGTGGHTGATTVTAGTLLVNGDYSGATGATMVAGGASLGGTGTIGGNVSLADGAILTPGAGGAGTLTIGGDLSLAAGTTLAYEFGQANSAGGTLNDLVDVGGDLILDGTIDVTVPAGGAFDVGVYRVFNYGGTLTNNGLTIGGMPGGASPVVQTSIAGQVNLVNTGGLALNFWDGAAGPKNNNAVNGGTGTWQNGTGNDNWTDADGTVNAAFSDGTFAVFGGTAGTVTVDNSLGDVTASGMQFAANGYTIEGDAVTLVGPQSIIRVGDGSTDGAGFTATISAALIGDTQLVKTDAGTLVLGGVNGYTGGTLVNAGTVQISADANLGATAGDVTLDGGTLATSADMTSARNVVMAGDGTISTASGTTFTYDGLFSGTGALSKAGAGTLLVTGDNGAYAGPTTVAAGTLAVTGSIGGALAVESGGRLEGTGTVGAVANAGIVAPGRDGFGTLTVASYAGSGGRLEIEAALGGDASPTDLLVVNGATAGTTTIDVVNRGGLGAVTPNGIKIVDVTGASDGVFTLNGDYVFQGDQAVIAGAYGYRLYKNGVATPGDGDWYLRSSLLDGSNGPDVVEPPLYQPGVPVYEAYGQTLLTLTEVGTMQQRVGNRQWAASANGQPSAIWGRMEAKRARPNAAFSTSASDVNVDSWKMEIGADHVVSERSDGATLVLGLLGGYGEAQADIASLFGNGSIKAKAYSAGATLSWFGPQGFYADGRVQLSWFDSKLKSGLLGTLADGNDGTGQAYSLEVGKRAPVGKTLSITPQLQMVYQSVDFDRFTDPNAALVSSDLGDSLKSRAGISVDRQDAGSHLYGVVNLSYEWLDGTVTSVSGTPIARENHRMWGELGFGGSVLLGDRLTLYSEVSANTAIQDFGDSYSLKGTAGLRLAF